jgi:hypothetical protein
MLAKLRRFGSDVAVKPTDTYISFVRSGKKFAILQVTADRIDVGIKFKTLKVNDRATLSGKWNAMVTHRVRIDNPKDVDDELLHWLRGAYDAAGT